MNYDAEQTVDGQVAGSQEGLGALWLSGYALIATSLVVFTAGLAIEPASHWWLWVFASTGFVGVLLVLTAAARPSTRSGLRAFGMAVAMVLLVVAMAAVLIRLLHWLFS